MNNDTAPIPNDHYGNDSPTNPDVPDMSSTRHGHGRPRKYHTEEERAAGHALNQQAYYDRHRDSICRKVQCHYQEHHSEARLYSKKIRSKVKQVRHRGEEPSSSTISTLLVPEENTASDITSCLHVLLMEQTPTVFVAGVYAQATQTAEEDSGGVINAALRPFSTLHQHCSHRASKIYSKEGCTACWAALEQVGKDVRDIVMQLEDLVCVAMLGKEALEQLWREGTLILSETASLTYHRKTSEIKIMLHVDEIGFDGNSRHDFEIEFPELVAGERHADVVQYVWDVLQWLSRDEADAVA
ncbi:hypothetical protein ARMSODRAFT_1019979 [Armillaria solidipes]|uniref:Uncharacterized protein n=1 Tax=Armillaria solidipes TaxID=1076256 RepID=A0A2H3BG92_9AGAR|nr:hypothetical protein ARMSODRAFT_1019979 [Armillaria solidipes]